MPVPRRLPLLALALSSSAFAAGQSPTPIDPLAAARAIDTLVEKGYTRHQITPNPEAADPVFLRRASLDLLGRIPTSDEARAFLGSMEAD